MAFDINRLRELYTLGGGINSGMPQQEPTFPDMGIQPEQSPIQVPSYKNPMTPPQQEEDFISYKPEYSSRDRYNSLLGQMPQRDDNISFGRRLVAGGMGLDARQRRGIPGQELTATASPVETMEKVMHAPYIRDVMAWKEQLEPTYKAAELENRSNINERTLAGNMYTARAAQNRLDSNERIANQKNETALIRARAQAYTAKLGRGWDWDLSGPTAKKMHKDTGQIIDTGIPTGKMDEETKIELQNEGRIEAARVTGESAAGRVNQAGWESIQYPDGTIVETNERTGEKRVYPPGSRNAVPGAQIPRGPANTIGTPSRAGTSTNTLESNRVINSNLQESWQTDRASRKHIKRRGEGDYTFAERPEVGKPKPSTTTFGLGGVPYTQADVDAYDEFRKAMDPTYNPPITAPNTGFGKPATVPGALPQPGEQGQKTVIKREYSESRKSTRITYSDGTTEIVPGKR